MRSSRPWLHLFLALMLVFNGVSVAAASVLQHAHMGASDVAIADTGPAMAIPAHAAAMDTPQAATMDDCHDATTVVASTPAAEQAGDCCQPQDCDCACAQQAPLSNVSIAWQLASPGHAGPVHPLHNGLAPPARLALIRPPIA